MTFNDLKNMSDHQIKFVAMHHDDGDGRDHTLDHIDDVCLLDDEIVKFVRELLAMVDE